MSDVYPLQPNVRRRQMQPEQSIAGMSQPDPSITMVAPQPPVVSAVGTAAGWTQDKIMLVVIIAIVIVALICIVYWYMTKKTEKEKPAPTSGALGDNVPDQAIPHQPIQQHHRNSPQLPNPPPSQTFPQTHPQTPSQTFSQTPSQTQTHSKKGKSVPVTHEGLVTSVDDDELDKYMNPGEPGIKSLTGYSDPDDDEKDEGDEKPKKKSTKGQKQSTKKKPKKQEKDDKKDDELDDLQDLE